MGVATTGTSSTRVFGRRRRTRVGFAPWKRKPSPSWSSSHGRPSRSVAASRAVSHVGVGRAGFERRIHVDGETAAGVVVDLRPGVHDVRRVRARASPRRAGAVPISRGSPRPCARGPGNTRSARWRTFPDTSAVPPPRSARCGATKRQLCALWTSRLPRRGRLIDEPGASRGAAHAVLLVELQVGEFEDEFLQRLGLRLRRGGHVGREPLAQATRIAFIAASIPPASLLTGM